MLEIKSGSAPSALAFVASGSCGFSSTSDDDVTVGLASAVGLAMLAFDAFARAAREWLANESHRTIRKTQGTDY